MICVVRRESELMRATRPVRDPLGVLEAKIAGKAVVEGDMGPR